LISQSRGLGDVYKRQLLLSEHITPWMLGCGLVIVIGTGLASGLLHLPTRKAHA
jgi:hypothetical protein